MSERPVAIVTGASSGIGMATALEFARRGYAVVLAARRVDRLEEVARRCEQSGGTAQVQPTDVSDPDQVRGLIAAAVERFARIDVMVNNAGFGVQGRIHQIQERDMRDIFDVNFFGVFYGCKFVAPVMMRRRSGHIFNVSSVIGKRGTPFNGPYCATKFAVCGLTDALRVEMIPYHVRVTCVCPGLTETEFSSRVRGRRTETLARVVGRRAPVGTVARKIAATVGKNRPELIFTPSGRALVLLSALWPRMADRVLKVYHDAIVRDMKEER